MNFKIDTAKLNVILASIHKGVGNKYTLPITEYLKISLKEKTLSITATNLINFITYIARDIEGEDGEAVVKADTLIKLASKTTKSDLSFKLLEGYIEVKGNGTYKLPLFEGEDYPTYSFNTEVEGKEITTDTLKKVFSINKSAIATELIMPCLTGYNLGSKAITTDGIKMCINDIAIFEGEEPTLITQTLADLIQSLNSEKVTVKREDNKLLFSTDNIVIFGTELDGIEEYPNIEGITALEHPYSVKVSKGHLLSALDRLSLFVDPFDNNGVRLAFASHGLVIGDLKKNSKEVIDYEEKNISEEDRHEVVVNIAFLKDILSVVSNSSITIEFGEDLPIKVAENKVVQILSTMAVE